MKNCEECHKVVKNLTKNKCQQCYRQSLYYSKKNNYNGEKEKEKEPNIDELRKSARSMAKSMAGSIPEFFQLVSIKSPRKNPLNNSSQTFSERKRELIEVNQKNRMILFENATKI